MIAYNIMRGNPATLVKAVKPKGSQTVKAMGENLVNMAFTLPVYIDFKLNDFIVLDGEKYIINEDVQWEKSGKRKYSYSIQFQHEFYDLAKVQLKFLDPSNGYRQTKFDIMGNASTIVGLVVESINQNYSGWSVGVVDDTEYKLFSFDATNCLKALYQLVDEFKTEVWFDNKTIHLQKRVQSSGLSLAYGKGNGLLNISRQNKTDANIITRLYVSGSSQNLPTGYRDNVGNLILPGGLNYYQDNAKVALYGLIEASLNFDIKPEREGSVTAVVAGDGNWKYFTDNTLDFDINAQLSAGLEAKVSFLTGQLAGYTFTINNYNHATKSFTINKNEDEKALDLPSNLFRPAVGDKYSLIDIVMPQSYVNDAEARLLAATLEYYNANSEPKFLVGYTASVDKLFVKQNNVNLQLGNTIVFPDAELGLNVELRIAGYTRDLENRDFYEEIEWADTLTVNEVARQSQQQQRTLRAIESSGLLNPDAIRKNIFLNRLSELNGYLMLSGQKVKAGLADFATDAAHAAIADYAWDADKWDGRQFADYLNQAVRTTDDVRHKSISSPNFVSGFTGNGWKVDEQGNATFDNLTVRKQFNVYELVLNKISGTNGALAVTDTVKIATVTETGTGYDCTIETDNNTIAVPFQVDDLLRCQVWNGASIKYYFAKVTAVGNGTFTIDKATKIGAGIPSAGDVVVRFGNVSNANRQGLLYLTASDTNAPYLDVLDGVNSDNLVGKTKVRLGRLDGITDADLGDLSGYGLYGQNVFVKGKIVVTGGNAQTIAGSQALANAAQSNAITTATSQAAADATVKASAAQVAAIQSAANDATIKANAAQQNAYNGAVTEAQSRADAAQAAAQNYAYAQAAYEREIAKAYADGIVDAEEQLRIAQAAANLQTAKDDAQNKVNIALGSANGYTDTKSQQTLIAAQAYADNTATTKANVAQANAISQASTDAQNKANAAQAAANLLSQQLVDGLKVGGRNFLKGTNQYNINAATYFNLSIIPTGKEFACSIDIDITGCTGGRVGMEVPVILKNGNPVLIGAIYNINPANGTFKGRINANIILGDEISHQNGLAYMINQAQGGTVNGIGYCKFEIGNKATDWTPAPEDVQAAIDLAKATADTAQANYNALTANLKSLAYQDVVELAKLGTTIIEGGKIKTTLLDADYIRANIVNAGYINTLALDATAIKSGTIDSARINASQIVSNGGGATTTQLSQAKQDAENAAKAYADAQDNLRKTEANAYADGKVSAEEQRAINDAIAKLNEAKADATTKDNAVKAYADNAKLEAINTATSQSAADATVKASAAQVAAIQAAANDATAKVNNLQIGGRNYVLNSDMFISTGNVFLGATLDNDFLKGKTLTISCDYELVNCSNGGQQGRVGAEMNIYSASGGVIYLGTWFYLPSNNYTGKGRVTYTATLPADITGFGSLGVYVQCTGDVIKVGKPKIEVGNKATDWTPAPEDLNSFAQTKANEAQTAATNAAYAQAAYEREVAKAYADGKVSAEEAARIAQAATNLQNAKDDATAKVNTALATANGYTDTKALATISAAQTYADNSATTKANAAQANAISQASTDAQNKANAAQASANLLSQQLIDGLKIGGRNYVLNSNVVINAGNTFLGSAFNNEFLNGKTLTLSIDYELVNASNGGMVGRLGAEINIYSASMGVLYFGAWFYLPSSNYTGKGRVTVTIALPSDITGFGGLGLYIQCAGDITKVGKPKIEIGNKATDWTPAPEDVQAAIDLAKATADTAQANYNALTASLKSLAYQDVVELAKLGTTIIEGGKIKTTLLDADYIRANIVNAAYINTLEIVTKNLKTSASGKRVEIDSANNNIRILNDQSAVLIEIDDDSAYEYTRLYFNGPPVGNTYTKFYGPGIRVGNETAARTTMGRYGFTVFDENNVIKHKIGTYAQSNVFLDREDVIFDIQNGFILKNVTASWDANNQYGTKQNIRVFAETISGDFGSAQVLTWTTV